MIELDVATTSAITMPRTTAAATTAFPRFLDGTTFAACGTSRRRRGWWWSYDESIKYLQNIMNYL